MPPGLIAIQRIHHRFSRLHVPDQLESQSIQSHALGGDHILHAGWRFPLPEYQGPDTAGVAECQDPVPDDERNGRVGTSASLMHTLHRMEDVLLVDGQSALLAQLVGQHVQENL